MCRSFEIKIQYKITEFGIQHSDDTNNKNNNNNNNENDNNNNNNNNTEFVLMLLYLCYVSMIRRSGYLLHQLY